MQEKAVSPIVAIILAIALLCGLLQLGAALFIYQHDMMWGQPWRWWTAHWVHVGWRHYGLNMLAFLCLPFVFPHITQKTLMLCMLLLPPLLSAGLYWLLPDVQAYAGLSGILHGIYVLVAIESLRIQQERKFAILVLGCIAVKLVLEKWFGYSETAQLIQAPVLIESHQIGVLTGIIFASFKQIISYIIINKNLESDK
jgi:rhomboid family GlyGly-CTERM serine protease